MAPAGVGADYDAIGTVRQSSAILHLSRSERSSWVGIVSRRSTTSRAAGKLLRAAKLAARTSGMSLTGLGYAIATPSPKDRDEACRRSRSPRLFTRIGNRRYAGAVAAGAE